jgi:serine-type D-Ala-D-Ala carboxypeptidase
LIDPTDAARRLLADAIDRRVFPTAVAEVGDRRGPIWRQAVGRLTFDPESRPADDSTIFDLASLTKPLATTTLFLQLMSESRVALQEPLGTIWPEWRGEDRDGATVQDLLEHSSGLAARLVERPPASRREFEHEICVMRLEAAPRTRAIYSDLGFILLGFLIEDRGGAPLSRQLDDTWSRLVTSGLVSPEIAALSFGTAETARENVAPTEPLPEDHRRGRRLQGVVHDNYAALLGGVAGHSGLFSSAAAVGACARAILEATAGSDRIPAPFSSRAVMRATRKSGVPGSSRALGWDTMLPTSSCGTELSPAAFGHTGFTGTSLWIDPVLERYFVLLTNRVCGGGTSAEMQAVRRAFHDACAKL